MHYWLNVHDPERIGEPKDYQLYLKSLHENTILPKIKKDDFAVIYEIAWPKGKSVIGTDGKPWTLDKGRKGIVGIVQLGQFQEHHYRYNNTDYIGWFEIEKFLKHNDSTALVPFSDLDSAWKKNFNHYFSPRINGGIRELHSAEWLLIKKLVNLE
jgi:hypothetical protein